LDVEILSIAFDSPTDQARVRNEYGIDVPMLHDADKKVSETYNVLQWAVGTGEPGHTFILVDKAGKVAWIRDYGAPENGGLMYVPVTELTQQIKDNLSS
jgi:peroxiredoxin